MTQEATPTAGMDAPTEIVLNEYERATWCDLLGTYRAWVEAIESGPDGVAAVAADLKARADYIAACLDGDTILR